MFPSLHRDQWNVRIKLFVYFCAETVTIYRQPQSCEQAEVIQNHMNEHVRIIGQGEARNRKYKRLKLGGGQAYARSSA
jgi:hypothetical protein